MWVFKFLFVVSNFKSLFAHVFALVASFQKTVKKCNH